MQSNHNGDWGTEITVLKITLLIMNTVRYSYIVPNHWLQNILFMGSLLNVPVLKSVHLPADLLSWLDSSIHNGSPGRTGEGEQAVPFDKSCLPGEPLVCCSLIQYPDLHCDLTSKHTPSPCI